MRRKGTFFQFPDGTVKAYKGDSPETPVVNPSRTVCPMCRNAKAKKKPYGDMTQYGFDWDTVTTFFDCSCGTKFYVSYRIWHNIEVTV